MAEIVKIAQTLQNAEIVILKELKKLKTADIVTLLDKIKLNRDTIARACLWLQNKGLIKIKQEESEVILLNNLGEKYLKEKLPERRFLEALGTSMKLDKLAKEAALSSTELKFSLGSLKRKGLAILDKGIVKITNLGRNQIPKESLEEKFLKKLTSGAAIFNNLAPEEKFAAENLIKRGIVRKVRKKTAEYNITDMGIRVSREIKGTGGAGFLTSSMIKTGSWKSKAFRRYDVKAIVPRIYPGKKQAYNSFIDEVKRELISMGFEEMEGPMVENSFWNNDALYMPQDHPARGIHDIYFVKEPRYQNLSQHKKLLSKVKYVHERGGYGSKGWRQTFSEKESARAVLRSQGTAMSARMLTNPNLKIPGAYFAIGRVFRPEKLDATHLTEFNHCEGIVIEEKMNFRNLLYLLKRLAEKVTGTKEIKFSSVAYFPFTEPSVTGYIKHPKTKQWLEVMPAGVFRPEMTQALGIKVPVLAWGIGIDRLFMIREGISDIRQLFSQDISYLREAKI